MTLRHLKTSYYLIESLHWFALALPLPFSILLLQARGLNLLQISWLSALYSLTIVLLELPTGGLADAIGRKPVTLISYGFSIGSSLLFLLAFSMPVFALAFIFMGVSRALASGALNAWFIDSLLQLEADCDLQPHLAQAETFGIAGLMLGSLVAGFIPKGFSYLPSAGTIIFTPLSMTFVFAGLIKLIVAGLVWAFVKESRNVADTTGIWAGIGRMPGILQEALKLSRQNTLMRLLITAGFISALSLMSIETFWQPQFQALSSNRTSLLFGFLMTGAFLMGVLGNMLAIPLGQRLKKRYGLIGAISQGMAAIAILLLALQKTLPSATIFFCLYYFASALSASPTATLLNEQIPSARRSSMQSVISLASYAGSFVGSLLLGSIAQQISISAAWILAGALLLGNLILYLAIEKRRVPTSNPVLKA